MGDMSPRDFLSACELEGGSLYNGFEAGLRVKNLDDSNQEFNELMLKFQKAFLKFQKTLEDTEAEAEEVTGFSWN